MDLEDPPPLHGKMKMFQIYTVKLSQICLGPQPPSPRQTQLSLGPLPSLEKKNLDPRMICMNMSYVALSLYLCPDLRRNRF